MRNDGRSVPSRVTRSSESRRERHDCDANQRTIVINRASPASIDASARASVSEQWNSSTGMQRRAYNGRWLRRCTGDEGASTLVSEFICTTHYSRAIAFSLVRFDHVAREENIAEIIS